MDHVTAGRRMDVALKRSLDITLTNTNIVILAAVSIFLPYVFAAICFIFLSIYIIVNRTTRQLVFIHSGSGMMRLFFVLALAVPIMYRNWMGLAVGAVVILGIILGLFLRSVMTKDLYEKTLTLICKLSLTSAVFAILEAIYKYYYDGRGSHRISAVFFYPNYFGTIAATIVIICAYKILTGMESKWFFYITAVMNIISIYLCKSMFAWVEVFVGIAVLLAVLHKRLLLALWIAGACVGAYLIFVMDFSLIPRLSDVEVTVRLRQEFWDQAIEQIKATPWLGHGFMSFGYLFAITFQNHLVPHAHNIFLDMLLDFGIVGTILFFWYFTCYYIEVLKLRFRNSNVTATALILAVSAAALVHGTTDITLLWFQTLPLFFFVLSGLGPKTVEGNKVL